MRKINKQSKVKISDKLKNNSSIEKSILLDGDELHFVKLKDKKNYELDKKKLSQLSTDYEANESYKKDSSILVPNFKLLFLPKNRVTINQILEKFGKRLSYVKPPIDGYYTFEIKNSKDMFKISREISESGLVEWCHPDFGIEYKKFDVTPGGEFWRQWYLNPTQSNYHINVTKAWDITQGNQSVSVAVIDDGVQNHPEFAGRLLNGAEINNQGIFNELSTSGTNNLGVGHGTSVAGVAAAANDANGSTGVAPNIKIRPIQITLGIENEFFFNQSLVAGINHAVNRGAKVINMSLGAPVNIIFGAFETAVINAIGAGVSLVAAAGNNPNNPFSPLNCSSCPFLPLPASFEPIITVGAINKDGTISSYSQHTNAGVPERVDFVAPVGDVRNGDALYLHPNNCFTTDLIGGAGFNPIPNRNPIQQLGNLDYTYITGTSFAAPQVAGLIGLMLSVNPNLTVQQRYDILKNNARKNIPGYEKRKQGEGLIQACGSVFDAMQLGLNFNTNQLPTSGGTVSLNGLAGVCATSATWAVVAGEEKLNPWSIPRSGNGSTTNTLSFQNTATGTITVRFSYLNPCSSTNVTKDQIIQIGAQITSGNCYRIKAKHSGKVLEVAGASTLNGIDVWQVSPVATNNQQIWKFESTSGGAYKLTAQHSGKVMDVLGSSLANLATVVQHDWNGGDNQQFLLAATGDGAFKIRPKHALGADKVFDIAYASTQDFSKVIQYDGHGGDNQRFYLENATCPVAGGGGGSGDNTCGMTLVSAWINCNTGNPNIANVIEAATIEGAGNEELQFKLDAGGLWYNNVWNIMNVSNGEHTLYVRKKNNTACVATKTITICGSGSGGGSSGGSSGGGGSVCPTPGCLNVQGVWYNHILKVLEGVTVGGGTGQYQFAIDNCNTWYDYQWSIQNLTVGMHTVYVRDKNNISCGGQFAFNVIPASNMRQGLLEDSQNVDATIENIIVYPNPSSKEVAIKFSEKAESELTFSLITVEGKVIKTDAVRSLGGNQSHKMIIEGLPSGQYYIMLKSPFSIKSTRLMIE